MDHKELLQLSRQLSPADVCAQLLALCIVEYNYTPNLSRALKVNDAEGKLTDTGRGMRLTPDKGDTLAHAERALTGFYPCLPSSPEFDAILRELVCGEHGSPGPSVANFACRSLKFTSTSDGAVWSQSYSYGAPSGPAVMLGSTETTGTVIDFKTTAPINHAVVATLVEALRSRIHGLSIVFRSYGRSQEPAEAVTKRTLQSRAFEIGLREWPTTASERVDKGKATPQNLEIWCFDTASAMNCRSQLHFHRIPLAMS